MVNISIFDFPVCKGVKDTVIELDAGFGLMKTPGSEISSGIVSEVNDEFMILSDGSELGSIHAVKFWNDELLPV